MSQSRRNIFFDIKRTSAVPAAVLKRQDLFRNLLPVALKMQTIMA